jgi:hypothetical protein
MWSNEPIALACTKAHNLIRIPEARNVDNVIHHPRVEGTMARSGYAKGKNAGHVTEQIERKEKPSRTKGVRFVIFVGMHPL